MRKTSLLIILLLFFKAGFNQTSGDGFYSDADFLKAYSKVAFTPGADGKVMLRKWNQDIKIFIESSKPAYYKKQVANIIETINPYLHTIKIVLTDDRGDANCLIKIDTVTRTHYDLSWDETGNIYKGKIFLNNESVFNNAEQNSYISEYLMHILGSFHIPGKMSASLAKRLRIDQDALYDETVENIQSILKSRLNGFTEFDLKAIQFHYTKDLKAGISRNEFLDVVKNVNHQHKVK